jgi:hypothetical protein
MPNTTQPKLHGVSRAFSHPTSKSKSSEPKTSSGTSSDPTTSTEKSNSGKGSKKRKEKEVKVTEIEETDLNREGFENERNNETDLDENEDDGISSAQLETL